MYKTAKTQQHNYKDLLHDVNHDKLYSVYSGSLKCIFLNTFKYLLYVLYICTRGGQHFFPEDQSKILTAIEGQYRELKNTF